MLLSDSAINEMIDLSEQRSTINNLINNSTEEKIFRSTSEAIFDPSIVEGFGGMVGETSKFWESVARKYGLKSFSSFKSDDVNNWKALNPERFESLKAIYEDLANTLGRKLTTNPIGLNAILGNINQVSASDAVFAISKVLKSGEVDNGFVITREQTSGGTEYPVRRAINLGKPVYVFDQDKKAWFTYSEGSKGFVRMTSIPKLTSRFAAVTSSELNGDGKLEIEKLFTNTFGSSESQFAKLALKAQKTLGS